MKLARTAAFSTLALVALTALSAQPAAALAIGGAGAAMQDQSACPAPATAPAKLEWKHGDAEYKAYSAAASATDPAQKAQLAAQFIQTYPDSDYKNGAMILEITSQIASNPKGAYNAAQQLIKSGVATKDDLLEAYTVMSFLGPTIISPDDTAGLAALNAAATCGLQLAGANPSDPKMAQAAGFMEDAQGFVALSQKNFPAAIAVLQKRIASAPNDAQAYYWLGSAEIQSAGTQNSGTTLTDQQKQAFVDGIFYLARAVDLKPTVSQIKDYLTKVYNDYHGSNDGLDAVMTAAQSNNTPPSDFNVVDVNTIQTQQANAQFAQEQAAAKQALLQQDSWEGVKARLSTPGYSTDQWAKLKASKEALGLDGIVVSATRTEVNVAVGVTDPTQATTPDVKVILKTPLTAAAVPKVGQRVSLEGIPDSYTPEPNFLMTLKDGSVTPEK